MIRHPAILDRLIGPQRADFSPDLARYLLSLDFLPMDHARYADLSSRVEQGNLTSEEQAELDDFLTVNDFLSILKSKARVSLARHTSAA